MENNSSRPASRSSRRLSHGPHHPFRSREAKALDGRGDLLARLSLDEQRLNRTLVLAKADLKQLQQERVEAEEGMASCAALIRPSRPIALNGCC